MGGRRAVIRDPRQVEGAAMLRQEGCHAVPARLLRSWLAAIPLAVARAACHPGMFCNRTKNFMRAILAALLLAASLGACVGLAPEDEVLTEVFSLARRTDLTDVEAVSRTLGTPLTLSNEAVSLRAARDGECPPGWAQAAVFGSFDAGYEAASPDAGRWGKLRLSLHYSSRCGGAAEAHAVLEGDDLARSACVDVRLLGAEFGRPVFHVATDGGPATSMYPVQDVPPGRDGGIGVTRWAGRADPFPCANRLIASMRRVVRNWSPPRDDSPPALMDAMGTLIRTALERPSDVAARQRLMRVVLGALPIGLPRDAVLAVTGLPPLTCSPSGTGSASSLICELRVCATTRGSGGTRWQFVFAFSDEGLSRLNVEHSVLPAGAPGPSSRCAD